MGEPGRHIGIYLIHTHGWTWRAYILYTYTHTHTHGWTWRAYGHVSYTHARVNLESIYLTHTHTGEGGGHISYTHTHGWTWRAYGHIYYTHTRVNLEGIYLIHAHRIHFGLKNWNPASGTTMGEPRSHCPKWIVKTERWTLHDLAYMYKLK